MFLKLWGQLFCLLVVIWQVKGLTNSIREVLDLGHAIRSRVKRQSGGYGSENSITGNAEIDGMLCLFRCFDVAGSVIMDAIRGTSNSNRYAFNGQSLDQQGFEKTCSVYNRTKNCFSPCRDSLLRSMAMITYDGMDYLCGENYNDWQNNLPCLSKMDSDTERKCAEDCGAKQDPSLNGATINDLTTFMGEITKRSCSYIRCQMDCQRPELSQRCGTRAVQLLEGLVSRSLDGIDSVAQGMDANREGYGIGECRRLVQDYAASDSGNNNNINLNNYSPNQSQNYNNYNNYNRNNNPGPNNRYNEMGQSQMDSQDKNYGNVPYPRRNNNGVLQTNSNLYYPDTNANSNSYNSNAGMYDQNNYRPNVFAG